MYYHSVRDMSIQSSSSSSSSLSSHHHHHHHHHYIIEVGFTTNPLLIGDIRRGMQSSVLLRPGKPGPNLRDLLAIRATQSTVTTSAPLDASHLPNYRWMGEVDR
jgi:hypothetical protein